MFAIFFIIGPILFYFFLAAAEIGDKSRLNFIAAVFLVLISFFLFFTARRLHDLGISGLLAIALLVPPFLTIAPIALCFISGESKLNKYGQIPESGVDPGSFPFAKNG
jgi:uncharacterized membrane protein YhaH (DUF805 family)